MCSVYLVLYFIISLLWSWKKCNFVWQVKVMYSNRQPIRLVVLGNDAKEYKFLVKFGEDLRQDQRIQQLFSLMNQILANTPGTATKRLYLGTYGVSTIYIVQLIICTSSVQLCTTYFNKLYIVIIVFSIKLLHYIVVFLLYKCIWLVHNSHVMYKGSLFPLNICVFVCIFEVGHIIFGIKFWEVL